MFVLGVDIAKPKVSTPNDSNSSIEGVHIGYVGLTLFGNKNKYFIFNVGISYFFWVF